MKVPSIKTLARAIADELRIALPKLDARPASAPPPAARGDLCIGCNAAPATTTKAVRVDELHTIDVGVCEACARRSPNLLRSLAEDAIADGHISNQDEVYGPLERNER